MNKLLLSFIISIIFPALLYTQGNNNLFRVGLELQTGYGIVLNNGFRDEKPRYGIAAEWLNEINHGRILSTRLILQVPFGIRLYGGYHYSSFLEQRVNDEFWTNIFRQDMENQFKKDSHKISNTSRGGIFGIAYAPPYLQYFVQPYIFGELRSERLKARTRLKGRAENFWSIFGPETGEFRGETLMMTARVSTLSFGLGFEVQWGNIIIAPEWRYVSATSPIVERTLRYRVFHDNGDRSTQMGELDILDEQSIGIRYHSANLGVRFIPEYTFKSDNLLNYRIGIELQAGYGMKTNKGSSLYEKPWNGFFSQIFMKEIGYGYLTSAKVILYLPLSFRLYGGYQFGSYPESDVNELFWSFIYGLHMSKSFDYGKYEISSTSRGFLGGIAYAPPFLQYYIQPYIFGELRSERLRMTTRLHGWVEDYETRDVHRQLTGRFEGRSSVKTDRIIAFSYGFGIEKRWGRIIVAPEWRYLAVGAPIDYRRSFYSVKQDNGEIISGIVYLQEMDNDDIIKIRYHSVQLGIRFLLL